MNISDKIYGRYDANLQIISILNDLVSQHPDWRFQQILQNINLTSSDGKDLFYEESVDTLHKILENPIVGSIISN